MKNLLLYGELNDELQRVADERLRAEFGDGYEATADYLVWDIPYGIGMDDIREKMTHLSFDAGTLPQTVVLVTNAERLSPMCQGSLLTELENEKRCFVLCSRLSLSQTIESRCEVVSVPHTNPYPEYRQYLAGSDDLPDGENQMFDVLMEAFRSDNRAYGVLKALRLYKEKDKESFFALYKEDTFRIFRSLRLLYSSELSTGTQKTAERIRVCSEAEAKCLRTLPSANELNAALYAALA